MGILPPELYCPAPSLKTNYMAPLPASPACDWFIPVTTPLHDQVDTAKKAPVWLMTYDPMKEERISQEPLNLNMKYEF